MINGAVAANGGNGSGDYQPGGGSGGSISITTSALRGTVL